MNIDFNILHLTDLHAGQPKHANIYPHMCEGFFRDLDVAKSETTSRGSSALIEP